MFGSYLYSLLIRVFNVEQMFGLSCSLLCFSSQLSVATSTFSATFFIMSSPVVSCFFHFVLRFWNQILTCCSVTHSSLKNTWFLLLKMLKYLQTCSGEISHLHWGTSLSRTSSPSQRFVSQWMLSASSCSCGPGAWPRSRPLTLETGAPGDPVSDGRPPAWPR